MLITLSILGIPGRNAVAADPGSEVGRPVCAVADRSGEPSAREHCPASDGKARPALQTPNAIPGLVGTGYVAGGAGLAHPGTTDGNFKLVSCPSGPCANQPYVTQTGIAFPGPWVPNTDTAQWIGPAMGGMETGIDPVGVYDYRETFDLTGFDLATVRVTGEFASDNGAILELNGVPVGFGSAGFDTWTPLLMNSGFQPGVNTLDFLVTNDLNGYFNPSGLIVELIGTATPPLTTTTLVAMPTTLIAGQALTLTGTVLGTSTIAPTGTVGFLNGSGLLEAGTLNSSGVAVTTMHPATGVYSIVAGYEGDRANGPSESVPVTVTVYAGPPTFAITSSGPLTLQTQHHGSVTVTVTPENGFSGEVRLACGPAPQYVTCEWAASQVEVSGGAATVKLEIDTSAVLGYESSVGLGGGAGLGLALPVCCLVLLVRPRQRNGIVRLAVCGLVFCAAGSLSGCSTKYPPSTAPGTYGIPLLGVSGAVQSSGSLELIVTR